MFLVLALNKQIFAGSHPINLWTLKQHTATITGWCTKILVKQLNENLSEICFLIKPCSVIAYSFKCNSCNANYYGKTKHQFSIRAAEHMRILDLTNKSFKNIKQSFILDHLLTCDCSINFNDFTILSTDSNNFSLLIISVYLLVIARDKPILNKTVKSFPLELQWNL